MLDAKTEQLASVDSVRAADARQTHELAAAAQQLQRQLQHSSEALAQKDKEVTALLRQIDRLGAEKARAEEECRVKTMELRALGEDLANMTKENQVNRFFQSHLQFLSISDMALTFNDWILSFQS